MKILYLYAEVMGYTMATIRELAEKGNEVHVVHWDHKKLTPYAPPALPNVYMYNRSELTGEQLKNLVDNIKPAITVVSGWVDSAYMGVARHLRREGKTVVVGLDGQWYGKLKQWLGLIFGQLKFFSLFFSHAWVAGVYQYEYARKMGFDKKNIVFDLYCADTQLFSRAYKNNITNKEKKYPHQFLFVGRLDSVKGLDILLQAWKILQEDKADWTLHLIGNGVLREKLSAVESVVIKEFMQPEQLMQEVVGAGCFLLPSRSEPWGVVLHEFAAAGLPLIASEVVGAASTFLISGLNGFLFRENDAPDLAKKMRQIINMTDQELFTMAVSSHELSKRISAETSAGNILSLIQ